MSDVIGWFWRVLRRWKDLRDFVSVIPLSYIEARKL